MNISILLVTDRHSFLIIIARLHGRQKIESFIPCKQTRVKNWYKNDLAKLNSVRFQVTIKISFHDVLCLLFVWVLGILL